MSKEYLVKVKTDDNKNFTAEIVPELSSKSEILDEKKEEIVESETPKTEMPVSKTPAFLEELKAKPAENKITPESLQAALQNLKKTEGGKKSRRYKKRSIKKRKTQKSYKKGKNVL